MMATDRGQTSTGKASGPGREVAWPTIQGNAMPAKTAQKTAKRRKSGNGSQRSRSSSMTAIATQNLINMVVVSGVSGAILLGLLSARHF